MHWRGWVWGAQVTQGLNSSRCAGGGHRAERTQAGGTDHPCTGPGSLRSGFPKLQAARPPCRPAASPSPPSFGEDLATLCTRVSRASCGACCLSRPVKGMRKRLDLSATATWTVEGVLGSPGQPRGGGAGLSAPQR